MFTRADEKGGIHGGGSRKAKAQGSNAILMFSLFLPERCLHCEAPAERSLHLRASRVRDRYLCAVCARILDFQERPEEHYLRDQFALVASELPLASARSRYWFDTASPLRSIIHSFKYSDMPKLAQHFGGELAALVPSESEYLIPIPLHRTRMAERGYNQAEMLALGIANAQGGEVFHALRRTRPTPSQTQLTIPERIENVRGAFALTRKANALEDKHVLLIDDVMTTGSTLASAAEVLRTAKPRSIGILTLAAARK